MTQQIPLPALALSVMATITLGAFAQLSPARAEKLEVSKDIIAVQIRKQGFECENPESAERDEKASQPDSEVWILRCEGMSYRVQLVPNMAAKVERLSEKQPPPDKP